MEPVALTPRMRDPATEVQISALEDRMIARVKEERRDMQELANNLNLQAETRLMRSMQERAMKDAENFKLLRREMDEAAAKSKNDSDVIKQILRHHGDSVKDHKASIEGLQRTCGDLDEIRGAVVQIEIKLKDVAVQQDDASARQRQLTREREAHMLAQQADVEALSKALEQSRLPLQNLEKKVRDLESARRMQMEATQTGTDAGSQELVLRLKALQDRLESSEKRQVEQLKTLQEALDANDLKALQKSLEPRFEQVNSRMATLHEHLQGKLRENVGAASADEETSRLERLEISLNALQDAVRSISLETASVAVLEQQLTSLQTELRDGSLSELAAKLARVEAHLEILQTSAASATQLSKARFEQLDALVSAAQADVRSMDSRVRHVETAGVATASETSAKMKKDFEQCSSILKQLSSEADALKASSSDSDLQRTQAAVVQRGVEFLELSMKTMDMTSVAVDSIAGSVMLARSDNLAGSRMFSPDVSPA